MTASALFKTLQIIASHQIPSCYNNLLSQPRYMTLMLQEHFNSNLHLNLIDQTINNNILTRTVTLVKNDSKPVLLAEIDINIGILPANLKKLVMQSKLPFGFLLNQHGIIENFSSMQYFRISPNSIVLDYLQCQKEHDFFGRINYLHNQENNFLAKSTEILTTHFVEYSNE